MDMEMIEEVFHDWFTKSQPFLPPDADEAKSLVHFYKQIRRVRYLSGALDAALERARSLPLPDLPGMNDRVRKVAALMRELQRDAGDKSFICSVNVVTRFAALEHPEKAKRLLLMLEKSGVIECVERGAPHLPGKPGKSSLWRYKLSTGAVEITVLLTSTFGRRLPKKEWRFFHNVKIASTCLKNESRLRKGSAVRSISTSP
jgi:hypothetical protein